MILKLIDEFRILFFSRGWYTLGKEELQSLLLKRILPARTEINTKHDQLRRFGNLVAQAEIGKQPYLQARCIGKLVAKRRRNWNNKFITEYVETSHHIERHDTHPCDNSSRTRLCT